MTDIEIIEVLSNVSELDLITAFNKTEFVDAMLNTVQNFIDTCLLNGEDSTILSYQKELKKPLESYSYIFTDSQYSNVRVAKNIKDLFELEEWRFYLEHGLMTAIEEEKKYKIF